MEIVGIQTNVKPNGEYTTTLHCIEPFESYYTDVQSGRNAVGNKAVSIYVGTYDCSDLKVGMSIEIFYGQPMTGKGGKAYAPVKLIQVIE